MLSLDTCKKLKEAGFTQKKILEPGDRVYYSDAIEMIEDTRERDSSEIYVPELEELLLQQWTLSSDWEGWQLRGPNGHVFYGPNPSELAATAWLVVS